MSLRFGYWMPVFGGWLRNVDDEGMAATWEYVRDLTLRAEKIGFDLSLIAELNLNDIKGPEAPALDAWSTAAALAAVTSRIELMVAVRPNFHHPCLFAKQAANIDRIGNGRLSLNVVSSWWKDEAMQYGLPFDEHDDRYARTAEWLTVVKGLWQNPRFDHTGKHYRTAGAIVEPKPVSAPNPPIYAGGESETAKDLIARECDGYVMHGDPPDRIAEKVGEMRRRREALTPAARPMLFGVSGYVVCRSTHEEALREVTRITDVRASARGYANYEQWIAGTRLEQRVSLEDYSVSNRGLRAGLVGTPDAIAEKLASFEAAGIDLTLLQFSPQAEEMDRFAEEVIPRLRGKEKVVA